MTKYHIKEDGTPGVCRATQGNCPLGGSENHFDTPEAAELAAQERMEKSVGLGFSPGNPALQSEDAFRDEVTQILITEEDDNADTVYKFDEDGVEVEATVICDEVGDNDSAEGLEIAVEKRSEQGDDHKLHHVSVSDAYKIARGKKPEDDVHPDAKKAIQAFSENHGIYEGKTIDWEFGN